MSTNNKLFIELHFLQNFPPSNLNRDDIGQPKSTDFGGVRRARISSQCQKRVIRLHPKFAALTGVEPAMRTKMIVYGISQQLQQKYNHPADLSDQVAAMFASAYAGKMDDKRKNETAVLIYFSQHETGWVADELHTRWDTIVSSLTQTTSGKDDDGKSKGKKAKGDKPEASPITDLIKELEKTTKERTSAPDIALFGRMLADRPDTNIDAACQVAHAISTHAVGKADSDYYTAMDDVKQKMKDPGAGFLDVAYFNSACFYRYMRIDFAQLVQNLGDQEMAIKTVEGFMRAAEAAVPSGKVNSHAQYVRPSFMLAALRPAGSEAWNMANAYVKPIRASADDDLVKGSAKAFAAHFTHQVDFYGEAEAGTLAVALPDGVVSKEDLSATLAGAVTNMNGWVETIISGLKGA